MAEPIEMPIWKTLAWAQGTIYYMGGQIPQGKGQFLGLSGHSKALAIFNAAVAAASLPRSLQKGSFNMSGKRK